MSVDFQNVRIETFIFNLFCSCCAAVRSRTRILLLTCCVLNDAAWPKCGAAFYDILPLKLSLQVMDKNSGKGIGGATFI